MNATGGIINLTWKPSEIGTGPALGYTLRYNELQTTNKKVRTLDITHQNYQLDVPHSWQFHGKNETTYVMFTIIY